MYKKGFTLIEMMVSVAIFSVVMVIALGALLAISVSDRKAESLKSVINNLNFSLDSMSRAVRTGSDWNCTTVAGKDCVSGGYYINFIPATGGRVYYRLENSSTDPANAASICSQASSNVGCIVRSTNGTTWSPITSPEVVVSGTSPIFYMVGSNPGTDPAPLNAPTQPKLVITISGYVNVTGGAGSQGECGTAGNQCSVFHLQTAVTQRIYDQ